MFCVFKLVKYHREEKKSYFVFVFYINFFHPTTHDYIKTQPPQVQFFVLFYFHYILPRRILKKLKEKK